MDKMPLWTAHFPDALVGTLPSSLKKLKQRLGNVLSRFLGRYQARLATLKKRIGDLSKNIQLKLLVGVISGAHW
jgi:hypothetical protein